MRRCMNRPAWLAGVLLLLLQTACQSTARRGAFTEPLRHWPPPPAPARIALVGEVRDPTDFGIRPGVWSRVVNTVAGSRRGREPLVQPQGLAVDELGNLCIADPGAAAVILLDRARDRRIRWTGVGDRPFVMPVAVAKRGDLVVVADTGWGQVVGFDEDGRQRFLLGPELKQPAGIAFAGDSLWVADAALHTLFHYDLAGRLLGRVGQRGSGPGEFNFPTHLCAAPDGRRAQNTPPPAKIVVGPAGMTVVAAAGGAAAATSTKRAANAAMKQSPRLREARKGAGKDGLGCTVDMTSNL